MEYRFLKYLNEEELKLLENILLEIEPKEGLLKQIQCLENKTVGREVLEHNFSSSYIPNYDEKLEDKCLKVLEQLKANELYFFLDSIKNKSNPKFTNLYSVKLFYSEFENPKIVNDLTTLIDLTLKVYKYYNSRFDLKPTLYLDRVNRIFKYNLFQEDFEGPYNMINYIKNYIYYLLKQEDVVTQQQVFTDYDKKRELVIVQIKDISSYLCEIRNGTNLKLCIANAGLSRTADKIGEKFTVQQQLFIDALAFGTTLEKIENRDYEDYKKLLYLPKGKDLLK